MCESRFLSESASSRRAEVRAPSSRHARRSRPAEPFVARFGKRQLVADAGVVQDLELDRARRGDSSKQKPLAALRGPRRGRMSNRALAGAGLSAPRSARLRPAARSIGLPAVAERRLRRRPANYTVRAFVSRSKTAIRAHGGLPRSCRCAFFSSFSRAGRCAATSFRFQQRSQSWNGAFAKRRDARECVRARRTRGRFHLGCTALDLLRGGRSGGR